MEDACRAFVNSCGFVTLGYGLRRLGYLGREDGQSTFKLAFSVTLPALLFRTFSTPHAGAAADSLLIAPSIAIAALVSEAIVAWLLFRHREPPLERALLMGMLPGFKMGMFVFPIIEGSFGTEGLRIAALFDLPNVLVIFGYNRIVLDRCGSKAKLPPLAYAKKISNKLVFSPPMAAIWAGLMVHYMGARLPTPATVILDELANANKPLVMLGVGMLLQFQFNAAQRAVLVEFVAIRYAVALSAAAVVAAISAATSGSNFVYHVSIYVLCAPVAGGNVQSAVEHGCDNGLVVAISNAADIASFGILFVVSTCRQGPPHLLVLCLVALASLAIVCAMFSCRLHRTKSE